MEKADVGKAEYTAVGSQGARIGLPDATTVSPDLVKPVRGGKYAVLLRVRAKNSFGAKDVSTFRCVAHSEGDGSWVQMISMNTGEKCCWLRNLVRAGGAGTYEAALVCVNGKYDATDNA